MLNRIILSHQRRHHFAVRETYQGGAAPRHRRSYYWLRMLAVLGVLTMLPAVARAQCLTGGDLDPTFSTDGKVTTDFGSGFDRAEAVALQPDGKIVVAGYAAVGSQDDFALARYNANGTLDTTFSTDGKVTTAFGSGGDQAYAVAVQPDGKIVAAGVAAIGGSQQDFALARYNTDGSLDTTFSGDGKVRTDFGSGFDEAHAVALQPDGKIVVAGYAVIGGTYDFALARYNADGTLDTTFSSDGKVTTAIGSGDAEARAVALQPDGKIIAAGYAFIGGTANFALARYNADGTLDTTFSSNGKVTTDFGSTSDIAQAVALQPDGKIVAAGLAKLGGLWGEVDFALARYNANGTLDTTFSTDGKVTTDFGSRDDVAQAVALQPDGKIVAAGLAFIGGPPDFALARYNADGTLDTTFDTDGKVTTAFGSGVDEAHAVALQPDGKIVAAGFALGSSEDFALARYGTCPPPALQLTAAVSRKMHGPAGTFPVDLPLSGEPGVECRSGGANGNHTLVFTFTNNVVSANATVTAGTGSVSGNPTLVDNTMAVNLTGVTDVQKITITLTNVMDEFSQTLPSTSVSANILLGDTTGNKAVNSFDIRQTKARSGKTANAGNFRSDTNVSGIINASDIAQVKANAGHTLP